MPAQPDQADIVALNEKLTTDLAAATGRVTALEAQLKQANEGYTNATKMLGEANTKLAASESEVTKLKASQADFDAKVAAEVARKGISGQAASTPAAAGKTASLTEQCIAARAGK